MAGLRVLGHVLGLGPFRGLGGGGTRVSLRRIPNFRVATRGLSLRIVFPYGPFDNLQKQPPNTLLIIKAPILYAFLQKGGPCKLNGQVLRASETGLCFGMIVHFPSSLRREPIHR